MWLPIELSAMPEKEDETVQSWKLLHWKQLTPFIHKRTKLTESLETAAAAAGHHNKVKYLKNNGAGIKECNYHNFSFDNVTP